MDRPPIQSEPTRRYFDNAATSFPKPPEVAAAMARFMAEVGAPGRGAYAEAREAARLVNQCRERIRRLINGERADHIVFGHNASDALNLAIKGAAYGAAMRGGPGRRSLDRLCIISSRMEHNSVLRPLSALAEEGLNVVRVAADPATCVVDPADIAAAIGEARDRGLEVAQVILNHASNVTGTLQPVAEVGRICRDMGVLFAVDASQSLGHVPIDVRAMNIDLLAFPGHKGLLGPQGTGGLYIRPGVEQTLRTIREGGTGSVSDLDVMPDVMPDKYEPGSHNALGLAGLSEGVNFLLTRGGSSLWEHEQSLNRVFLDAIGATDAPGLRLLGPSAAADRLGVFSFVHETIPPAELAGILEAEYGILTRAGLHCAPLVHEMLGTAPPRGQGAVRFSFGPFLTENDVRDAARALSEFAAANRPLAATAK